MGGPFDLGGITGTVQIDTANVDAELAKVESAMRAVENQLQSLHQDLKAGTIAFAQYDARAEQLTMDLESLRAVAAASTTTFQANAAAAQSAANSTSQLNAGVNGVGPAMNRASGSTKGMGQALMMLSQTIDDAQYGFKSIVNNIPMLGMAAGQAFGMSADKAMAFGGMLGTMAVAINLNLQRLDEWKNLIEDVAGNDVFTNMQHGLRGVADELRDITGMDLGLVFDIMGQKAAQAKVEAEEAKKAAAGHKGALAIKDQPTQDRGKAFREAMEKSEGGGEAIEQKLIDQRTAGKSQAELNKIDKSSGGNRRTVKEVIESSVQQMIKDAMEGKASSVNEAATSLGPEFQKRMAAAMPEGKKAQKAEDKAKKDQQREADKQQREMDQFVDQEIKRKAKAIVDAEGGTRGFRTGYDQDAVRRDLKRSGDSAEKAEAYAPHVHEEVQKLAYEKLQAKALDMGGGATVDDAKVQLRKEYGKELERKHQAEIRETPEQREHKRLVTGRVRQFQKSYANPLDAAMRKNARKGEDAATTDARLANQLEAKLARQTAIPADQRGDVAKGIVGERRKKLEADQAARAMRRDGSVAGAEPTTEKEWRRQYNANLNRERNEFNAAMGIGQRPSARRKRLQQEAARRAAQGGGAGAFSNIPPRPPEIASNGPSEAKGGAEKGEDKTDKLIAAMEKVSEGVAMTATNTQQTADYLRNNGIPAVFGA